MGEPEKISETDLSNLKLAEHLFAQAQHEVARAQAAKDFMLTALTQRHNLSEKDSIDLETGVITREEKQDGKSN